MSTGTLQTSTFARASLGVDDLDAAVAFYTAGASFAALPVDEHHTGLLASDGRLTLLLTDQGPRGLQWLVYEVADADVLATFEQRLAAAGIATSRQVLHPEPDAVCFRDPDGYPVALVLPQPVAAAPAPSLVSVREILHPLLQVADLEASIDFYSEVLGFRISDRIADVTAFLRCADGFHHSLAITRAKAAIEIDHLCFQLPDLDTLMRARNRLRRRVGAECTETFRHGGSESITFYFQDPHSGQQIEFCADHRTITAADHQPRVLPAAATTFDLWEQFDDQSQQHPTP